MVTYRKVASLCCGQLNLVIFVAMVRKNTCFLCYKHLKMSRKCLETIIYILITEIKLKKKGRQKTRFKKIGRNEGVRFLRRLEMA